MLGSDTSFGIISAYQSGNSKKQNKNATTSMLRDLQEIGLKPIRQQAHWEYMKDDEPAVEKEVSFIVEGIPFSWLIAIGEKYNQEAVIYKDPTGVIGMYFPEEQYVLGAIDPKGEAAWSISNDKDLYSKLRGWSFEFGFNWDNKLAWDGRRPLELEDILAELSSEENPFLEAEPEQDIYPEELEEMA